MEISINGEFAMAYFPADEGVGGALIAGPGCYPSDVGSLIYLNAGNDLEGVLGRVELAGGRVIMAKTHINDASGNFALFIDSEGNRLALHEGPARSGPAPKAAKTKVKAVKKATASHAVKKVAKKKR
ncbi:MAG: VOC family protein [Flavobacteriales bacterium]|nr:VOC family protein [Flavobacteriales bacterium]